MDNTFELAFEDFLEGKAYDRAEQAMFDLVRAAFMAGWQAGRETPMLSDEKS